MPWHKQIFEVAPLQYKSAYSEEFLVYRQQHLFYSCFSRNQRNGEGTCVRHPIISDTDLKSLYTCMHLSINTPQGLLNKGQFDIRMFFCRRGIENMHYMTKYMFRVETDEDTARKVVKKVVDDLTKNHRLDKETFFGIMPEIEGLFCF